MFSKLVLREATVDHKQRRLGICQLLLNARRYVTTKTIKTIGQMSFEMLQYSVYSPDLAPSDYNLFGSLKDDLQGCQFFTDEAARKAVHKWLHDQPKTFFFDRIYKLVDCWKKFIEKGCNYGEK